MRSASSDFIDAIRELDVRNALEHIHGRNVTSFCDEGLRAGRFYLIV